MTYLYSIDGEAKVTEGRHNCGVDSTQEEA